MLARTPRPFATPGAPAQPMLAYSSPRDPARTAKVLAEIVARLPEFPRFPEAMGPRIELEKS